MNADEFLDAVNGHAAPGVRRADRAFLTRYHVVLGSGPYYQADIPKAVSLLGIELGFLNKLESKKLEGESHREPPAAISQIVVIHNSDKEQCHRIRRGLLDTDLINYAGNIYVNFSPFTRRTIASLPKDAFAEAEYEMEYSVFEEDVGEEETKPLAKVLNPVFFARGLQQTLVQNYFLVAGRRQPDPGRREPLPRPLYKAFLGLDAKSSDKILEFMNKYGVSLSRMVWGPGELEKYVASGGQEAPQMGIVAEPAQLCKFWGAEQDKMRLVYTAAAQGQWRKIRVPPVFPVCETAPMEWRKISGYFDPSLFRPAVVDTSSMALFEFKQASTGGMVRVKRYYGWSSYMWAELAEDIYKGNAILVCENCGRPIAPGKHGGSPKRFCSRDKNLECYLKRKAATVRVARSRRKP